MKFFIVFLSSFFLLHATAQYPIPYLKKNGKYIYVDSATMKPLSNKEYFSVSLFYEGLAKVQYEENGKFGFIDKTGVEKIAAIYDWATRFKNGLCEVSIVENYRAKYGFIDKTGKQVVPCKYDFAFFSADEMIKVQLGNKYGYVNMKGEEVIPCTWEEGSYFADGMAPVAQAGKWGFINKTGKLVIPAIYQYVIPFASGVAMVQLNGKWGLISKTGKIIVPLKYSGVAPEFSPGQPIGFAIDDSSGKKKFGCIDKTGKVIVPFKFDWIKYVSKDVMLMRQEGIVKLVNNNNVTIKTFENFSSFLFTEGGMIWVQVKDSLPGDDKWSLIDAGGNEITPGYRFENRSGFYDGLAAVQVNGKWGMINTKGKMVISPRYDNLSGGYMWHVKVAGRELLVYIDLAGREYYEQ